MPLFFSFRSETVIDDEALELFKNCDKNGDGLISHDELKEVLKDVDVNLTDQAQYIYWPIKDFFRLLVYQGGVKSTVSGVFEDLKFKISEGYKQN